VQALTPPNPFTISDMSKVWIVCDVYENNMAQVHIGEYADIHLTAYPDRVLKARISNILPIVDPSIRTAKVRLEVDNPGLMRLGMFVTATFHGQTLERRAMVPATAILHLHDREWVYTPVGDGHFRRLEAAATDKEARAKFAEGGGIVHGELAMSKNRRQNIAPGAIVPAAPERNFCIVLLKWAKRAQ